MKPLTSIEAQLLADSLVIMDGGYIALRSGRYCVLPRKSNQHTVSTHDAFLAVERGYAVIRNQHVHVTPQGWAFCGLA